jgi:hypothetical protein
VQATATEQFIIQKPMVPGLLASPKRMHHSKVIADGESASASQRQNVRRFRISFFLAPSLSDVLFLVLLAVLFLSGSGFSGLLDDSDTGWHIRTGEYILKAHAVPVRDLFSNTAPNTRWYAWEWLADIVFAGLHQVAGFKGVVLFSAALICLTMVMLFRYMMWRGASLPVALLLAMFVADSLRFHYLARPHLFTTLFAVISLWMLDRDWTKPDRRVWWLVPLTSIWVNVHGGFLILLVALGAWTASAMLRRDANRSVRYGILGLACGVATLMNPYGWQLHVHIWDYLHSDWLMRNIDEFQSPLVRGGSILPFEILLFSGLICTLQALRARRFHEAFLVVFWAHAALTSARHLTLYAMVATPLIADELTRLWNHWTANREKGSVVGAVADLVRDTTPSVGRTSIWAPVFLALLAFDVWSVKWPVDFPAKFPTNLIARNSSLLNRTGLEQSSILSPDDWGGYLDYKFYPARRTFVDGRSDYYGPAILKDYLSARSAAENWPQLAARYGWEFALIPPEWPLSRALKQRSDWILRDQDKVALLFERRPQTNIRP